MPLNASNRLNLDPPTGRTVVQMTVRPSSRAVAEGWNTQVQRAKSTSPSTDAITEVATVPASRRVVYDRGVPSTTGGHNWRARHVKEGSTEGDWTDWKGGGPRTGPGEPIPPDFPHAGPDTEKQAQEGPQNLLGPDAGPEQSGTAIAAYEYLDDTTVGGTPATAIADLGLEVGGVVSAGADLKTDGTTPNARLDMQFLDSSGTVLDTVTSPNASTTSYQREVIEDATIPASTTHIRLFLRRNSGTAGTVFARRAMLNRGPFSQSFVEPGMRHGVRIDPPLSKLQDTGDLNVDIQHGSGFRVSRHHEERKQPDGSSSVSFSNTYDSVPHTVVTPADGARVFSSSNSGADQFHRLKTSGLDVQGFDELIGEIVTNSQTTSVVDGFSSTQNTGAPENGDVTLSADGDTAFSNLEDANQTPVDYVVFFDWDASNLSVGDSVTLHIEVNNSSGGTSWTEVTSKSLVPGNSANDDSLSFNQGLDANYDIRGRASADSGLPSWSITMHGEDNTQPGVQYDKDTGSAAATMSPSTSDKVLWQAEDTA